MLIRYLLSDQVVMFKLCTIYMNPIMYSQVLPGFAKIEGSKCILLNESNIFVYCKYGFYEIQKNKYNYLREI